MTGLEYVYWAIVVSTVLIEALGGLIWVVHQREVDQCRK